MRLDARDPAKLASVTTNCHNLCTIMNRTGFVIVPDDQVISIDRRADSGDSCGITCVVRDVVRPKEAAIVLFDRVQLSGPVRKIHGVAFHGWRGGNVSTGTEYPLKPQFAYVIGPNVRFFR